MWIGLDKRLPWLDKLGWSIGGGNGLQVAELGMEMGEADWMLLGVEFDKFELRLLVVDMEEVDSRLDSLLHIVAVDSRLL